MTDVVLFHHTLGLTPGVRELGERLGAGGHTVHTPDLYDGVVAASLEEGMAVAQGIDDDELDRRVQAALADVGPDVVYAGISWGVMSAQRLAQTRPGALGALLFEACVSLTAPWSFGPWPEGVAVQIHGMEDDPFFAHEGDLDAARGLVDVVNGGLVGTDGTPPLGDLYTYPGSGHLFVDSSLPSYDAEATDLVVQRALTLLDRVGRPG